MNAGGDPRTVTSPRNAAVQRARALENDRALRDRERLYLAWGIHLAQEALRARAPLRQVFVGPRLFETGEGRDLLSRLERIETPKLRTTTRILDSIVRGSGDQGVLLLCVRQDHPPEEMLRGPAPLVLAAHAVQDPGNLGSILRSAGALGATGLLALPGCADPFGSRAVRAAMGMQFTLPVATIDLGRFLAISEASRLQLVAADAKGERTPPQVDLTGPAILLVGSEGSGLPTELLRAARARVRIPMATAAESLNVHAAAAVLLYEAARQRSFRSPGASRDA